MNDAELDLHEALEEVLALDAGERDDVLRRLQLWVDSALLPRDDPDAKRYPLH